MAHFISRGMATRPCLGNSSSNDKNEPDTLLTPLASSTGFEEFMALIEIPNVYASVTAAARQN
jgi:hypothetical protein